MIVGTAAMIWVGGSILIHGLEEFGLSAIAHWIEHMAELLVHAVPAAVAGFTGWAVVAFFDGLFGLAVGMVLIPIVARVIAPLWSAVAGAKG
jgi:predicted DNA repair protein MutK